MEFYCPKCGNKLVKGDKYYCCSQKHLGEIWQPQYSSAWHFHEVKWATCAGCLEEYPAPDLTQDKKCPKCHQKEKDAWQMDSEKSHAILTITPVLTEQGKTIRAETVRGMLTKIVELK
jgi:hypothetical protein